MFVCRNESAQQESGSMSTTIGMESSALLRQWSELCHNSGTSASVVKTADTHIKIRVDPQTTEWILDFVFPTGGPAPKIINTLKFIKVQWT